jgi:hypothetical protein
MDKVFTFKKDILVSRTPFRDKNPVIFRNTHIFSNSYLCTLFILQPIHRKNTGIAIFYNYSMI